MTVINKRFSHIILLYKNIIGCLKSLEMKHKTKILKYINAKTARELYSESTKIIIRCKN